VEKLGRRGKYLVWELEDEVYLMLHLRMTGTLLLNPAERPPHTRVTFDLGDHSSSSSTAPLRHRRARARPEALGDFFAKRLGVEPFEPEFTGEHLYELTRTRRAPIRRCCSTRSGSPASATSTPTRRSSAPRSTAAAREPHQPQQAARSATRS
jgi:formamidopyrimidine-DNA glycosylase